MTTRDMEKSLEWEPAAEPITIQYVDLPRPAFLAGTSKVTIRRDAEMRLELIAEGKLVDPAEARERENSSRETPAGTFIEPVNVSFDGGLGGSWTLRTHFNSGVGFAMSGTEQPRFTQHGTPILLRRTSTQRVELGDETRTAGVVTLGPAAWRSEWFINGPHAPVFCRGTKRRRTATYSRDRKFGATRVDEAPSGHTSNFDHFVVDADGLRFAVTEVPKEMAPPWCHPISIEFPAPIPDPDVREAVAEIVSFVLGRRLMPVGSTVFDATGWSIEEEAESPWGQGIVGLCSGPDIAPVPLNDVSDDAERVLTALVPRYLELRQRLGLDDALLTYWQANEAFAGINLTLYSSALEGLKTRWFEANGSKSKGLHMSKKEYDDTFGDLVAQVRERLDAKGLPRAIANRIADANRMSGGEQLTAFFDEVGITIGGNEREAMRARNRPTHGGIGRRLKLREFVRHGHAYRAIFERTFLKLLGYDGTYIDRTSIGYPARPIDDPCGMK